MVCSVVYLVVVLKTIYLIMLFSFSQMKMIKTQLRNLLNDSNLTRLMRIAIEGPELNSVNFAEILDIFKQKNRRISL